MMSNTLPYSVPQEPGRWRAIALALFVHTALLTFLWVGIRWQSDTPVTIEAEIWNPQALEAAPPPPPVQPAPEVKLPPPEVKETPVEKPDIALEQDKRLKKEKKAREKEEKAREEKAAEKEKAEKKLAEEKKRKKQDAIDSKVRAQLRDADIKRMAADSNATNSSGTAAKSQGSKNAAWAARVAAKVKSNITFAVPADLDGNPAAEFEVGLLPDGSVAGVRKTKSSGIPGFDEAVRRAIDKSQLYPADSSGRVPSSFISSNRPKDQ